MPLRNIVIVKTRLLGVHGQNNQDVRSEISSTWLTSSSFDSTLALLATSMNKVIYQPLKKMQERTIQPGNSCCILDEDTWPNHRTWLSLLKKLCTHRGSGNIPIVEDIQNIMGQTAPNSEQALSRGWDAQENTPGQNLGRNPTPRSALSPERKFPC